MMDQLELCMDKTPLYLTARIIRRPDRDEYDLRRARAASTQSSYEHLKKIYKDGMVSKHVWEIITGALDPYSKKLTDDVKEILKQNPEVQAEELDSAWREFLRHQRLVVAEQLADHSITEEIYSELVSHIDNALDLREIKWDDIEDINNLFDKELGESDEAEA